MNWNPQIGPEMKLALYARSFHTAAKTLAEEFKLDSGTFADFGICPVLYMYRHAAEFHLKAFVLGDGGNFLATKPDPLSICKTRSLSWLAQFVCQIVTALKWEREFTCEGTESLGDFKAIIDELNSVDPSFYAFRQVTAERAGSGLHPDCSVPEFVRRVDLLLGLLETTAAAVEAEFRAGSGFETTIQ